MYVEHPDKELNALFRRRPFQGVAPEDAELIFIGLDANYAEDVATTPIFPSLLEYHSDGVGFWRRHGVHHPFLLPGYRGDGRRYHQNFARIGFGPRDAGRISFVELLDVPTVGRSDLQPSDLSSPHLRRLASLFVSRQDRHIFLSANVLRLMGASAHFPWLKAPLTRGAVLQTIYRNGGTVAHLHLHFSNYGKFETRLQEERAAIAQLAMGI